MNQTDAQLGPAEPAATEAPAVDGAGTAVPITFVGTLPPPVSGMTVMTKAIVDRLIETGPVRVLNWSPGRPMKGFRWRLARAQGFARSLSAILFGHRHPGEAIYAPASSRWGQLYDLALGLAARLRGFRLVVHHHVYSYIDKYDWRTGLLNRLVGKSGGYVVHCQKMADDFKAQYPTQAEFYFVPPTVAAKQPFDARNAEKPTEKPAKRSFAIGLLSNLMLAKGLDTVVATFQQLAESTDVRLILAGPCMGKAATELVEDALRKRPEQVQYLGPVGGEQKAAFYRDIDVFLLPTRNESWGIVLTEALAAGKPVIAYDRGCIEHIVQGGCGLVIPRDADFVAPAVSLIKDWLEDPAMYAAACEAAIQRSGELEHEANDAFADFLSRIRSPSDQILQASQNLEASHDATSKVKAAT